MASFPYDEYVDVRLDDETIEPSGCAESIQCVNPQDTEKQYHRLGGSQLSMAPSGFMTPCSSRLDSMSRRPSLMLSDTAAPCNAGAASASSTSSLNSSPGDSWYCMSSVSTAASSRRQSVIYQTSPSPAFRGGRLKESLNVDHYSLPEPFANGEGVYSNIKSFNETVNVGSNSDDNGFLMPMSDYSKRVQLELQENDIALGGLPAYSQQNTVSTCLGMDLVPDFSESLSSRLNDAPQSGFESDQPSSFTNTLEPQGIVPSHTTFAPSQRTLESPFQCQNEEDMSASGDEGYPPTVTIKDHRVRKPWRAKQRTRRNQQRSPYIHRDGVGSRPNTCPYGEEGCIYSCPRPEHLNRHIAAKHSKNPKEYPCEFPDCIDKKTGEQKVIKVRNDNFKAHYTNTHFSYGQSEKSGKNRRWSMKVSIEKALMQKDNRWALFLAGKMTMDRTVDGKFLNAWKMIGYSIKETRGLKVKDIAPEWQGPEDTTLAEFDPRLRALNNGTLTYEQAMSVGTDMEETPAQGLLGLTMAETEDMGLRKIEPRWKMLDSGKMSIEDSEKLGVKHLNPVWIALQAKHKH